MNYNIIYNSGINKMNQICECIIRVYGNYTEI